MDILTILGIAVALAMDAFAVALATGVSLRSVSGRQTFRLSWHFGLFQAMMPVIGWFLGGAVESFVTSYAPWLAFALLAIVGANMMREALFDGGDGRAPRDATRGFSLVMLSVATSIDALAVGFSLSLIGIGIVFPALTIGAVAGIFTIIGLQLGKRAARLGWLSSCAEFSGGLVLWLIGLDILLQHQVFSSFL